MHSSAIPSIILLAQLATKMWNSHLSTNKYRAIITEGEAIILYRILEPFEPAVKGSTLLASLRTDYQINTEKITRYIILDP